MLSKKKDFPIYWANSFAIYGQKFGKEDNYLFGFAHYCCYIDQNFGGLIAELL